MDTICLLFSDNVDLEWVWQGGRRKSRSQPSHQKTKITYFYI